MLGDVSEPDPIGTIGGEVPHHQVIMGGGVGAMPALAAVTHAVNIGFLHQACHPFTTDTKTQAHAKLRVDPGAPYVPRESSSTSTINPVNS